MLTKVLHSKSIGNAKVGIIPRRLTFRRIFEMRLEFLLGDEFVEAGLALNQAKSPPQSSASSVDICGRSRFF